MVVVIFTFGVSFLISMLGIKHHEVVHHDAPPQLRLQWHPDTNFTTGGVGADESQLESVGVSSFGRNRSLSR